MCQVAHFSEVDVDDDGYHARSIHIEDLLAQCEEDGLDDFELSLDPDEDDDEDDDFDDEEDDE